MNYTLHTWIASELEYTKLRYWAISIYSEYEKDSKTVDDITFIVKLNWIELDIVEGKRVLETWEENITIQVEENIASMLDDLMYVSLSWIHIRKWIDLPTKKTDL